MKDQSQIEYGTFARHGTTLHYTRSNPAATQTIFMIHAGLCDSRMWQPQIDYFSQDYQVIAVDMYGSGKSGTPTEPFSYHEDLFALLDYFDLAQTWIMAASLGGALAFDMALMQPRRVHGLILASPAIADFVYDGEPHPLSAKIDAADDAGDLDLVNELEIQMWVDGDGRAPDALDQTMRNLILDMNLIALRSDDSFWQLEQEIDPPASERLAEIQQPVLLIYGDLDIPKTHARNDFISNGLSKIERVLIAETAHLPNMEQPEQFNRIVSAFLAQHA